MGPDGLVVAPTFGPRCALCWERFLVGDEYRSIWPKRGGPVRLGISVHPVCYGQLEPGDLGRIFGALELGLRLPLAALRGRGGV